MSPAPMPSTSRLLSTFARTKQKLLSAHSSWGHSNWMIDRHVLLLRVNAIIEGNGPDDHVEAGSIAQELTRDIPNRQLAAALAAEFAYCLQVIGVSARENWNMDARPHARELVQRIEAEHRLGIAAAQDVEPAPTWPLLQRTAGSLRRLLSRPIRGRA